jgi:hypothetical protein
MLLAIFSDSHMPRYDEFEPNGDPDLEAGLDEEFPLGDGTVDTEATVVCPYCAEEVAIALDPGSGAVQEYIEDCAVCCQPWTVLVSYHDGFADVAVRPLE